jgi:predicted P-loop ATPase
MKYNISDIKRDNPLSEILPRKFGVTLQRDGREWKACCPLHGENTPSFTVYPSRDGFQKFHCFGCGAQGDVVEFVQQHQGVDFTGACEILGGKREVDTGRSVAPPAETIDPYAGYRAKMPPADAPAIEPGEQTPPLLNPKRLDKDGKPASIRYTPSRVHAYRAPDGTLRHYVLRVDVDEDRKITPAILWAKNKDTGFEGWSHGSLPEPRRLYGLEQIGGDKAHRQRLVVEGEKCADEFNALGIKQMAALSWAGGGKAYAKTDWSELGDAAVFWPDNDDEGVRTMLGYWTPSGQWRPGIIELAFAAGLKRAKYITPPGADRKPKGWDVADAIQIDKLDADHVLAFMREWVRPITLQDIETRKAETYSEPEPKAGTRKTDPVEQAKPIEQAKPDTAEKAKSKPAKPAREKAGNVVAIHGAAIPEGTDDDDEAANWKGRLLFNGEGAIRPRAFANMILYCRFDPQLRGIFGYNTFDKRIYLLFRPPWERPGVNDWKVREMSEEDYISCTAYLERHGLSPKPNDTGLAVLVACRDKSFNPLVDYLKSLKWDGIPRVRGGRVAGEDLQPWLSEYLGADNTPINRAFGMRWLIAACARAMQPGCKVDNMLILEGPQGRRKSLIFKTLANVGGRQFFSDSVGNIEDKDSVLNMQRAWIIEHAEMDMLDRHKANSIKAWMTRTTDTLRRPYAKASEDFPRHFIFAGTVNPNGTGYLKDATGGRRFWPVTVKDLDVAGIEQDRDQLWAEAMHLFLKGEQWWLTEEEEQAAREVQSDRTEMEPWEDAIERYVRPLEQVTAAQVLRDAIGLPVYQHNNLAQKRVAESLYRMGWIKKKVRLELGQPPRNAYVRKKEGDE